MCSCPPTVSRVNTFSRIPAKSTFIPDKTADIKTLCEYSIILIVKSNTTDYWVFENVSLAVVAEIKTAFTARSDRAKMYYYHENARFQQNTSTIFTFVF